MLPPLDMRILDIVYVDLELTGETEHCVSYHLTSLVEDGDQIRRGTVYPSLQWKIW